MAKGIKIIQGISEWIRDSVGTDAENRGQAESTDGDTADDGEEDEDGGSPNNSPVCCSAASNSDLSVLEA
jgi:hypothetical protein